MSKSSWQQNGMVSRVVTMTVSFRSLSSFCRATEDDGLTMTLGAEEMWRCAVLSAASLVSLSRLPKVMDGLKKSRNRFRMGVVGLFFEYLTIAVIDGIVGAGRCRDCRCVCSDLKRYQKAYKDHLNMDLDEDEIFSESGQPICKPVEFLISTIASRETDIRLWMRELCEVGIIKQ